MDMVRGPITGTYHTSKKYNKKILVLGDIHILTNNCPESIEISQFINKLLKNKKPKFFDIFIESILLFPTKLALKFFSKSYLKNIITKNHSCFPKKLWGLYKFLPSLRGKKCPSNVRYHYADPRQTSIFETKYSFFVKNSMEYLLLLNKVFENVEQPYSEELVQNIMKIIKDRFVDINNLKNTFVVLTKNQKNALKEFLPMLDKKERFDYLMKNKSIKKEYSKVYSAVKPHIKKWIENIEYPKEYHQILIKAFKDQMTAEEALDIPSIPIFLEASILDVYAICRMFKPIENKEHPSMENIIIYAGEAHTNNIRNFFDNIGMTNKSLHSFKFQCMEIPQNLFD